MAEYKAKAIIEVKKGERIHTYQCENNTPLGEIFDALTEMRSAIIQSINENEKKEAEKNEASKHVEEVKECHS